jgi:hypothetical protein
MAKYTVKITMDNAAFNDDGEPQEGQEVARLLRRLAANVEYDEKVSDLSLNDVNGNKVCIATRTR